jgi:CDP-glycerol glycerophosphotransferase (TagB/SpsB family)
MTRLVSIPLGEGGDVLLEVAGEDERGFERVGRGEDAVKRATETVQDALRQLRPAAQAMFEQFRAMSNPPDKISLQFGIKVTGEAQLVIAKAASEANFQVSMEWQGTGQDNG